ncbi:family 2 glycosyl transferase [Candidatus Magnetoovum chiemensis]|nr:family 2 glycosyl transferase [Candidatus Magnetoovum chiemensis]
MDKTINEKFDVFMFAAVPYDDIGSGQRSAQFTRVLLNRGYTVFYVHAYKKYDLALGKYVDSKISIRNLLHVYIDDLPEYDIKLLIKDDTHFIFEMPHKCFLPALETAKEYKIRTVFDLIDDWETSLGGDWYNEGILKRFITECSAVSATAQILAEQVKKLGRDDVVYLPNAADETLFNQYGNWPIPKDMDKPGKKYLYFGSLYGEWFGWDYIKSAAHKCPNSSFFLIGDNPGKITMPENVHFLGMKPIEDLPMYLKHCDAALLPFIPGKISDAVSPIKIFEYLFLKKIVISTDLPEIKGYPNVLISKDEESFANNCAKAVNVKPDDIDDFIIENNWGARLDKIINKNMKKTVSVVIIMHNNINIIGRCLKSMLRHRPPYLKEIIVVDNDSKDNSAAYVKDNFSKDVTLIINEKNGCSSGRNLGAKGASGDYIAFFDSDQWITSRGCFEEAVQVLENNPHIGAVSWSAGWFEDFNEHLGGPTVENLPKRGVNEEHIQNGFRADITYLSTAGMFLKKDVFDTTEGFDEAYDPTCFEDTDFSFQIKSKGLSLAYRNMTGICHEAHSTTKASEKSDYYMKLFVRNSNYCKYKWRNYEQFFDNLKASNELQNIKDENYRLRLELDMIEHSITWTFAKKIFSVIDKVRRLKHISPAERISQFKRISPVKNIITAPEKLSSHLDAYRAAFNNSAVVDSLKNKRFPLDFNKLSLNKLRIKPLSSASSAERIKSETETIYRQYQINIRNAFAGHQKEADLRIIERDFLKKTHKGIIVYPSAVHWKTPLVQRPHHIFKELAGRGYTVFFLSANPDLDKVRTIEKVMDNLYVVGDARVLKRLTQQRIILWMSWTPMIVYKEIFTNSLLIYDWIDEIDVFYLYGDSMAKDHETLLKDADMVFVSAEALLEKIPLVSRQKTALVRNGVNIEDFLITDCSFAPDDIAAIKQQHKPIAGFYGSLEKWIDYELVNYLCETCKDMNFVFIGPSYDGSYKKLKPSENLFLLGPKEYRSLKYYLKQFDLALIPFQVNRITDAVFPVKLCEFMAGGKITVTTNIRECRNFRSVFVSNTYEDFARNLKKALFLKDDKEYAQILKDEAIANTWKTRADVIEASLKEKPLS